MLLLSLPRLVFQHHAAACTANLVQCCLELTPLVCLLIPSTPQYAVHTALGNAAASAGNRPLIIQSTLPLLLAHLTWLLDRIVADNGGGSIGGTASMPRTSESGASKGPRSQRPHSAATVRSASRAVTSLGYHSALRHETSFRRHSFGGSRRRRGEFPAGGLCSCGPRGEQARIGRVQARLRGGIAAQLLRSLPSIPGPYRELR